MAKPSQLQLRLRSVNEVRFTIVPGQLGEKDRGDELRVGFMYQLNPDIKKDVLSMDFGVQYTLEGKVLLEAVYTYVFEVRALAQYVRVNENGKTEVKDIMPHMVSVAAGTMRGILVVRTAGTDLAKYPIPMMDAVELSKRLAK